MRLCYHIVHFFFRGIYYNAGIKLKLVNALFNGKHTLVNTATVDGSGLEVLCHIANDARNFIQLIKNLDEQPFTQADIDLRKSVLKNMFNNEVNAKQQVQWIWTDYA